ncbi:uncharacterized protein LOC122394478 [Amphibalanus amphitrite]|uniref:uncharacterized protein LOC122394478 n=1 Tax=Amphibalanus amphitrite TaxID=1232801 RepID=UPI001C92A307|nr:uncharacterized protein LOC122394478 [Amphibalanus amphitrite]
MMREDHEPETAASPPACVRPRPPAIRSASAPSPCSTEPVSVAAMLAELGDASSPLLEPLDWPALVALGAGPSPTSAESPGSEEPWNPHLERWQEKLRQRGLERWKEKLRAKRAQDEERQSWGRLERLVQRLSPVQRPAELAQLGSGVELEELAELSELDGRESPLQWQEAGGGRESSLENGSTHDYAEIESSNERDTTGRQEKVNAEREMTAGDAPTTSGAAVTSKTTESALKHATVADVAHTSTANGSRGGDAPDSTEGARRVRTRRRRKRRLVRSESAPLAVAVDFWSDGGGMTPDEGVCLCAGCGDVSPTIARTAALCRSSAPSLRLRCGDGGAPRLRLGTTGENGAVLRNRPTHGATQQPQRGASHPNLWQRPKSPDAGERSFDKYRIKDPKQGFSAWAQRHLDLIEEAHSARPEGATSLPRPVSRRREARQLRARARRSYPSAELDSDEEPEPVGRTAPLSARRSASVDSGTCTSPATSTAPLDSAARAVSSQPQGRVVRSQSVDSGRCESPLSSGSAPVRRAPRRRPLRPRSVELPPGRSAGVSAATGQPRVPLAAGRDAWLLAGPGRGRLSAYFIRDTGVIMGGGRAEPPPTAAAARSGQEAAALAAHLSRALALVPDTHPDANPETHPDTNRDINPELHPDNKPDTGLDTYSNTQEDNKENVREDTFADPQQPAAAEDTDSDFVGRRTSSNTSTLSSTNLVSTFVVEDPPQVSVPDVSQF